MNFGIITTLLLGTASGFIPNSLEKTPRIYVQHPIGLPFNPASNGSQFSILVKDDDWREETLEAALNKREPSYLPKISEKLGAQLKLFSRGKLGLTQTKENLSKHAYSLLFTMRAYKSAFVYPAAYVIANAAADAAAKMAAVAATDATIFPNLRQKSYANKQHAAKLGVAINAARHMAMDTAREATWKSYWKSARNAAWYSAWEAAWQAVEDAAWEPVGQAAWMAAGDAIWDFVGDATLDVVGEGIWEGKNPTEIGLIAFREVEKVSSLSFLDKFDFLVGEIYTASIEKMTDLPEENIFHSLASWNSFKSRHFGIMDNHSLHFVQPWLDELDWIVELIEAVED